MAAEKHDRQLYRSSDAIIGGVCAGIAEYFSTDTLLIRILAILLTFVTAGLVVIPYIILWATLDKAPDASTPLDVQPEEVHSATFGCFDGVGRCTDGSEKGGACEDEKHRRIIIQIMLIVGAVLLLLGIMSLVSDYVSGIAWWQCWPLLLVIVGIIRMVVPGRAGHELMAFAVGFVVFALGVLLFALTLSSLNEVVLTMPYGKEYFFRFKGGF